MAVAYGSTMAQVNSYKTQSVVGLTPGHLLLRTYDIAITSLSAGDGHHACKAISSLIETLDFEHAEIAGGLFRLYRYCLEEIKRGELKTPGMILAELRDTWADALGGSRAGRRAERD